ncbi:type II toxin-antitoxin system HicA family toxin [Conexibacter sp. JD483]|uniref:type II toxin-antitoxin system HicA family toxin n=1 Tax=unclassified Conexibacter TaxID=2627773 RepID=UPI002716FBDF|nr:MULTISPECIES: type II toxin-antitoxin system HicA family toxin [unclassified Conexibacter]MDO8187175.1 type II toxin-antitoxin system HicA family toxin [Conexibacter sp. CPCC 205706]MDO8200351.1 type II toxin-antitoxin system HicA family toxin [Conexibacter sp. CPCC 205762]MDR9373153.1 type II toxin-antitoxin system HicA family toxin [Conexibacter sp. JD483]
MDDFPSMKAKALLAILTRDPLGYRIVRQRGSHRRLRAPGRPPVQFAWHDRETLAPGEVRAVLTRYVGLDRRAALDLL